MAGRPAAQTTGIPIYDQAIASVTAREDLEGNGAPAGALGLYVGQRYWRLDGGVGTTLYRCTVIGTTWVASAAP